MMRKVYGNDMGDKSDGFEKTEPFFLSDIKVISAGRLISKKENLKILIFRIRYLKKSKHSF